MRSLYKYFILAAFPFYLAGCGRPSAEKEPEKEPVHEKNDIITLTPEQQKLSEITLGEYLKNRKRYDYFVTSALANAALILKNSRIAYQNGEIGYTEYLLNLKQANGIYEGRLMALLQLSQSINQLEFLTGNNQSF